MQKKINHYKTRHGVEVQPIAFEMTGGRHSDTDKYLNKLFRKSVKIGDPYAMRRLYVRPTPRVQLHLCPNRRAADRHCAGQLQEQPAPPI